MNIPWNMVWYFTEITAKVIGLFIIGLIAIGGIIGLIVWLKNQFVLMIISEIRQLRRFNKKMAKKVWDLANDKRFSEKEQKELHKFWFECHFDSGDDEE